MEKKSTLSDMKFPISVLFLAVLFACSILTAQNTWFLPFADKVPTTENEVRKEIENVELTFSKKVKSGDINLKIVKFITPETSRHLAKVYSLDNNFILMEYPTSWALNSVSNLYFNKHGQLRMIKNSAHGSTWLREEFLYFGLGKIWHFSWDTEVKYPDESGIGKYVGEELPISQRIVFLKEGLDSGTYDEQKNQKCDKGS